MTAELNPSLSSSERIAYDLICAAAEAGEPCPNNIDIEVTIGAESTSMGPWIVRRLELKGLIFVKRYQRFREVKIMATGKWTARPKSMAAIKPHVPRGCGAGSRSPAPTERKNYKSI